MKAVSALSSCSELISLLPGTGIDKTDLFGGGYGDDNPDPALLEEINPIIVRVR